MIIIRNYVRRHILRYLTPQLEVKINPCTPHNDSKNIHSPSLSITCIEVRKPGNLTKPSDSTLTGKVSKIRITTMSQFGCDYEKTAKIVKINISVQPDSTLLSPMTKNTPP